MHVVGVGSTVLLAINFGHIFPDHVVHGGQKIELTQKIHACRG